MKAENPFYGLLVRIVQKGTYVHTFSLVHAHKLNGATSVVFVKSHVKMQCIDVAFVSSVCITLPELRGMEHFSRECSTNLLRLWFLLERGFPGFLSRVDDAFSHPVILRL